MITMQYIQPTLKANQEALSRILGHPGNIGVELSPVSIQRNEASPVPALLCWVEGLIGADALSRQVLEPLGAYRGEAGPEPVARALPVARKEWSRELPHLVDAICRGAAVLLADGWDRALVMDMAALSRQFLNPTDEDPSDERFRPDLRANIAMLRWRLRQPELRAEMVSSVSRPAGEAALIYVQGTASPALVRLIRCWARRRATEEIARQGGLTRYGAVSGLLPRFQPVPWPDKAAMMLASGYVLVVVDRVSGVLAAPVTMGAFLNTPEDGAALTYPLGRWLARTRLLLYLLVLWLPGAVVALLNYHQEMVPTVFLLAVASVRDSAPFGIPFEVLAMELLVDLVREASFRLPAAIPAGLSLITLILATLILVHVGFIGPLPALAALTGSLASLALPSYSGAYLVRVWRYFLVGGAVLFGYFGMATAFALLVTYLCQHRSWGHPFLRPWDYGRSSLSHRSGQPREKEGKAHG